MIYEAKKAADEANALQRDGISILKFKSTVEKRQAEEIEKEIENLANKYLELRNHIVGFDHRQFNIEGSLYDFDELEEHLGLGRHSFEFSQLDIQTVQKSKSEIIKNALRIVCDKLNAQTAAIFLIDKNGFLRRTGIYGWNKDGNCIEDSWFSEEYYEVGESFTGNAATNRRDIKSKYGEIQYTETLSVRDLKEASRSHYQEALGDLRCAIAIPLNGRNKTYGVLRIINKTYEIGEKSFLSNQSFSKEDINLLLLLSTYIANTLSNFRRDVQNKIFNFLSQLMVKPNTSQKEDMGKTYKQILDLLVLNPETAFKAAILREKNEKSGTLDVLAIALTPDVTGSRDSKPRRPGDDGFLWLIAESKSGKPLILQNIQKEEQIQQFKNRAWIKENNFQAFGCFPLMVEGEVVGTLSLYTGYDYEFYSDSVSFLQSVTGLIASFLFRTNYEKSYVIRQVEEKFHTLANQWRHETASSSSIVQKSLHKDYQQIIGLGSAAVPLLLKELANRPDHWFWALSAITGANPVEPEQRGRINEMTKAWLAWGKEKGYVFD
ncbi:MAG: GAF domain-containing protein [Lyngbya sp. HA4199-MV5]|jgi:GAF domain-containing protein|nr:GAF domain-containing protein [Lyngbya sp. HA4199-MV5]